MSSTTSSEDTNSGGGILSPFKFLVNSVVCGFRLVVVHKWRQIYFNTFPHDTSPTLCLRVWLIFEILIRTSSFLTVVVIYMEKDTFSKEIDETNPVLESLTVWCGKIWPETFPLKWRQWQWLEILFEWMKNKK